MAASSLGRPTAYSRWSAARLQLRRRRATIATEGSMETKTLSCLLSLRCDYVEPIDSTIADAQAVHNIVDH
jgi:hypothetical protein